VVLVLRTHLPFWRSRPSQLLVVLTLIVGAIAISLPYLAFVARPFSFVPLSAKLVFAGFGIVILYVCTTEAAKRWFYARAAKAS
jgi:Mg2+-importing ATPase